jgi:hypothetical protein
MGGIMGGEVVRAGQRRAGPGAMLHFENIGAGAQSG